MAALDRDRQQETFGRPLSNFHQRKLRIGTTAYRLAVLGYDPSTGAVEPMTANNRLICLGYHPSEKVVGDGIKEVRIDPGVLTLYSTGLTDADEGKPAYAVTDQDFSLDSLGGTRPCIGLVEQVDSPTQARVAVGPVAVAVALSRLIASPVGPGADLTNADATITIAQGGWRVLSAATLTANRAVTLSPTGARAGDEVLITRLDATAFTFTIVNGGAGGGNVVVLPVSQTGFCRAYFDGTNWKQKQAATLG